MTVKDLIRHLRRLPAGEILAADVTVVVEDDVVVTLSLGSGEVDPEDDEGAEADAEPASPKLHLLSGRAA